ncbi:MAG: type II toxin-antitoxin system HicA family toxin [Dehalococcoidia bacterium]|nr:type II toxin-antitoxin system HicA family toxin [Dehalococcoidia bacterium]
MTKLDKSIARIVARPSEADFGDVRRVLEAFGWAQARQVGSHISFTKAGERSIVMPLKDGSKVKRVYLDELCERLGLDPEDE